MVHFLPYANPVQIRGTRKPPTPPGFRVPAVYLGSAFLAIWAIQALCEISNLHVLNTAHGFDSRRLHQLFVESVCSAMLPSRHYHAS
jgi:hypothetical protein